MWRLEIVDVRPRRIRWIYLFLLSDVAGDFRGIDSFVLFLFTESPQNKGR
jgi:hypothetical protein